MCSQSGHLSGYFLLEYFATHCGSRSLRIHASRRPGSEAAERSKGRVVIMVFVVSSRDSLMVESTVPETNTAVYVVHVVLVSHIILNNRQFFK